MWCGMAAATKPALMRQNTKSTGRLSGFDIDESSGVSVAFQVPALSPAHPPPAPRTPLPLSSQHVPRNCTPRHDAIIAVSQLREALSKNMVRVVDLFREWDTNGDGTVNKAEFRKAMPKLGLRVPASDVDALFDSWDPDGSGTVEINELSRVLRQGSGAPEVQFSKAAPLDHQKLAQNASPEQLRAHLSSLKEQCEQVRHAQSNSHEIARCPNAIRNTSVSAARDGPGRAEPAPHDDRPPRG